MGKNRTYDLYVETGSIISGKENGIDFSTVKTSYEKIMNLLIEHMHETNKFFASSINCNGYAQHPKPRYMTEDASRVLLMPRRTAKGETNKSVVKNHPRILT